MLLLLKAQNEKEFSFIYYTTFRKKQKNHLQIFSWLFHSKGV